MFTRYLTFSILFILLAACSPSASAQPSATNSFTPSPLAVLPTRESTPTKEPTVLPTIAPTLTSTPGPSVCSPLEGYLLFDLPGMIVNPFHPPAPGSDDPHQAVDLAVLAPGSRVAVSGNPVDAALPGRVVMALNDRFPYGNMVLVETPVQNVPSSLLAPTPAPTLALHSALTCPPFATLPQWDSAHRSLYLLYAHLKESPAVQPGSQVSCGQKLGTIGSTGNALNPHLHLEVRIGPASAQLKSMAHYDTSATNEEMSTYCLWRVSGVFQLVDPMQLLTSH